METINEKIIDLLKQHPEGGEKFFNALDLMLRSDVDILDNFVTWAKNRVSLKKFLWIPDTSTHVGIILTGSFGRALLSQKYRELFFEGDTFKDLIVVNGGIRSGEPVEIFKSERDLTHIRSWVLLDDSYYSGTTAKRIEDALRSVNPFTRIIQTLVIYDGSKEKKDRVSSLFRYYDLKQ